MENLNFGDALKCLKQGRFIQREQWLGSARYLFIRSETSAFGDSYQTIMIIGPFVSHTPWTPRHEDLLAEDWRIMHLGEVEEIKEIAGGE